MASCSGADTSILNCEGGGDAGIWYLLALIINILSIGIGILAVIGITICGIQYITAAGDVSKTTKAKRRIFEIVIGIAVYAVFWGVLQWLLPGGIFNKPSDIESISISIPKTSVYVDETTTVNVKIEPSTASDKTYSLASSNTSVATTSSSGVRCEKAGQATITAVAFDGKTSTATITCKEKPKEATPSGQSGSSSSSSSSSSNAADIERTFIYDEAISPSNGGKNIPASDFLKIENYNINKTEAINYVYAHEPTYNDLVTTMAEYGIEEDSDGFLAILGWTYGEGYYWADNFLGYLSSCVMINNIVEKRYGEDPFSVISKWPGNYSKEKYKEHVETIRTNPTKSESVAAIRSTYLALKYLRKGVHNCYGVTDPENVPAKAVYVRKITNYWGTHYFFVI